MDSSDIKNVTNYYYLQSDSVANVLPALHALYVVLPRANCHVSSKKSAFIQKLEAQDAHKLPSPSQYQ